MAPDSVEFQKEFFFRAWRTHLLLWGFFKTFEKFWKYFYGKSVLIRKMQSTVLRAEKVKADVMFHIKKILTVLFL